MSAPSDYYLPVYLSQTDLSQVAISAEVDAEGNLHPIGGLFEKLTAAARSGLEVGVPRIVILSDKQNDIPSGFRDAYPLVTILQAGTLAEAAERLAREQGEYLAVRDCELHQHERRDTLDPTVGRPNYFEHHYQVPKLRLARAAGKSPETPSSVPTSIDLLAWEAQVRQLRESYESLTLTEALARFQPKPGAEGEKEIEKKLARPMRLAIIGQPGSGKTMLERYLARLAAGTTAGQPALFPRLLLPIYVRLRDWKLWSEEKSKFGLPDYLAHYYETFDLDPPPSAEQFRHWLNRGETLILYDGLDEIEDTGDFLSKGLKVALGKYPLSPVVLSCRTPTFEIYRSICHDFDVYLIGSLSEEQRNIYIERYPFERKDFDRRALIRRLDDSRQLRPLVTNPLLLAVVCLVADREGGGALPGTRAELYHRAINHLLRRHQDQTTQRENELPHIRRILERAARQLFEDSGGRKLLIEQKTLTERLSAATEIEKRDCPNMPRLDNVRLLNDFEKKSGLLRRDAENRYYFLHLTFHEYLAACGLAARPDHAAERLLDYALNPRWREVVLMTLGQLSREMPRDEWKDWLIRFLQAPDPLGGELVPRAALLFVEALPELSHIPEQAVEVAAQHLLDAQADCGASPSFAGLHAEIGQAVERLASSPCDHVVELVLLQGLEGAESADRKLAAASLVPHLSSYTPAIAAALQQAQEVDSAEWNWPIDAALRDLAKRQPGALPDRRDSLRQELLRNPVWARRFVSKPAWLRLGIAVYGGLSAVEKEDGNLVAYDINRMHRDSPLTKPVLDALKADQPAISLVPLLEKWCRTGTMSQRMDAFLALAALGKLGADGSAIRKLGVADLTPHLGRVARSLDAILPDLAGPILQSLGQLRERCSLPRWHDMIIATLTLLQRERPIPHGLILKHLPADDPIVLAECWNAVFTNPNEYWLEAMWVFAERWERSVPHLVDTLASYGGKVPIRWDRRPGAAFDDLPLVRDTPRDKLIVALEALDTIPDLFGRVRNGWAIPELLPDLASSGVASEAVLILRNTPLNQRDIGDIRKALEKVAPIDSLADSLFEAEPGEHPRLTAGVVDHYLRFRCYKRLLQFHPAWRTQLIGSPHFSSGTWPQWLQRLLFRGDGFGQEDHSGPAVKTAEAIHDPEERARAFTELAALDENRGAAKWREQAQQVIGGINDPRGKVIALVRLARWSPPLEQRRRLAEACQNLGTIEERTRAELLALLRKEFGVFAGESGKSGRNSLPKTWQRLAAGLHDPWHQSLAYGVSGPWFLCHDADFNPPEVGALLSLRALLADLERVSGSGNNPEHLWPLLATSQRPAALAALTRIGEEEGLVLTASAAAVLHDLYQRGEREMLHRLLPLMDGSVAAALPVLTTWLASEDAEISRHAALLLAEIDGLSARTAAGLLEWLTRPRDRCTHRAIMVLTSGRFYSDPIINTSQLGLAMLMTLAHEYMRHQRESNPQSATQIHWMFERIIHDDPTLIRYWVQNITRPESDAEASTFILSKIWHLHEKTWPAFHNVLRCEVPAVRHAVMQSLCSLLDRNKVDADHWEELAPTLLQFDAESLREWVFVSDPPGAFCADSPGALVTTAARILDEKLPPGRRVLRAEELFNQSRRSLADVWPREESELRTGLTSLGEMREAISFDKLVQAAVRRVEENPDAFDLLIDWLDEALIGAVRDELTFIDRIGSLLGVVAAAAEALPERYYHRASQHGRLPHNLRRVVVQHDTFDGRAAALRLLSHLRRVTPDTLSALKAGLRDVEPVQATAIQSVSRYRDIETGLVEKLCYDLYDDSPVVAYATAQLLAALARSESLLFSDRQTILEALKKAAANTSKSARTVHLLTPVGGYFHIESAGRLDQIFHHLFIRLSTTPPPRDGT